MNFYHSEIVPLLYYVMTSPEGKVAISSTGYGKGLLKKKVGEVIE